MSDTKAIQELELIILSNMIARMPVYMSLSQYPAEIIDTADLAMWFEAIRECYSTTGSCDMMSVMGMMKSSGQMDQFTRWMERVAAAPIAPSTIEQHIKTLVCVYSKRILDRACRRAMECHSAEEAHAMMSEGMENASLGGRDSGIALSEMADAGIDGVVSDDEMIPFGFSPLDMAIRGAGKGELIILGGYSKHGKTTAALQFAVDMSKQVRVNYYSLEMTRAEVFRKIVSRKAVVSTDDMQKGRITTTISGLINTAIESLKSGMYKLKIIDDIYHVDEIIANARLAWMRDGMQVMFVDYLQLCDTHDNGQQRYLAVGEITRKLKRFAQQTGVRVVAMAQMNGDEAEKPTGANFRESKNIFQDCNMPLIVWHDKKSGKSYIIVDRNRRTGASDIDVIFEGRYSRFRDAKAPVHSWNESQQQN